MFLKKRNKKSEYPLKDKAAKGIAAFLIKVQEKFAVMMNKRFAAMSFKRIKTLLIVFCGCTGGLSIYYVIHALSPVQQPSFNVDQVQVPKHINVEENESATNVISKETYEQILDYKKYVDSTGQGISKSLLDSMSLLEQIYIEQQKNEAHEPGKSNRTVNLK